MVTGARRGEWLLYLAIVLLFFGIVAVAFVEYLLALFILGCAFWALAFGTHRTTEALENKHEDR